MRIFVVYTCSANDFTASTPSKSAVYVHCSNDWNLKTFYTILKSRLSFTLLSSILPSISKDFKTNTSSPIFPKVWWPPQISACTQRSKRCDYFVGCCCCCWWCCCLCCCCWGCCCCCCCWRCCCSFFCWRWYCFS